MICQDAEALEAIARPGLRGGPIAAPGRRPYAAARASPIAMQPAFHEAKWLHTLIHDNDKEIDINL